jgi:hypothetical protein
MKHSKFFLEEGIDFDLFGSFFVKTELDIAYCGILSLLKVQVKSSQVQVKRNSRKRKRWYHEGRQT